ncbi:unnamed protein product [Prunus brigantina]
MVESDQGKWVKQAWWSLIKASGSHGGVTPINLGKSRPPP